MENALMDMRKEKHMVRKQFRFSLDFDVEAETEAGIKDKVETILDQLKIDYISGVNRLGEKKVEGYWNDIIDHENGEPMIEYVEE